MISPSLASRSSRTLTLWLTAALTAAIAVVPAIPAFAHSELLETTPAAGSKLSEPPTQVQLVFGENVQQQGGAIVVQAGDGSRVEEADTFASEANVATVQLAKSAPAGTYTVNFRVVSADGHVVSDTFSYRVTSSTSSAPTPSGPATTSSAAASSDSSPVAGTTDAEEGSGSSAIWVLGLGAIGLVLVAAMIAVVVRGRRDSTD